MIYDALNAAELLYRCGSSPVELPAGTIVYVFDTLNLDGPDRVPSTEPMPAIARHQIRLEMYSPNTDPNSESALEKQLLIAGLLFTKSPREWLSNVQRYLVAYELSYTAKI